jgi:nucleoside-diphosphate-sugar epimerase
MRRRILIAGCGYLGQATADALQTAGWEVVGLTRSTESAQELLVKPYRVDAIDISNTRQVATCAENFDAVLHCASTRGGNVDRYRSVYLMGTRNLLDRFPQAKILFCSSTSVYAQNNSEWVTEESPAEPQHETGKILRETEQLVLARGGDVARLSGIYGPGRSFLIRKFLDGEAIVDPKRDRFVNQIHRDDAAAALFFLLNPRSPGGGIYNVVDDQPILQSECYHWLAERLNRAVPPLGRSTSKRKRGESNKRVSNAKLRALGWAPSYSTFAEAMEKSILPTFWS